MKDGSKKWRTYTIPAPGEPGSETWKQGPESHSKDAWMHGGGSTWVTGSYDADLDVIYWGAGNLALTGITSTDQEIIYTVIVY